MSFGFKSSRSRNSSLRTNSCFASSNLHNGKGASKRFDQRVQYAISNSPQRHITKRYGYWVKFCRDQDCENQGAKFSIESFPIRLSASMAKLLLQHVMWNYPRPAQSKGLVPIEEWAKLFCFVALFDEMTVTAGNDIQSVETRHSICFTRWFAN